MAERQLTFWFCLTLALSISLAAIGVTILFDAATLHNGAVGRITMKPGGGLMAIAISIALFAVLFRLRMVATVASVSIIVLALFFTAIYHLPLTTAGHNYFDAFHIGTAVFVVVCVVAICVLSAIHLARGWMVGLIAAPVIMVIGVLSLLSFWYPQLALMSLGSIPEATIVVSPLAILVSLTLPFLFHFDKYQAPLFSRGLVLVGVLGITITTITWHIMRLHASESLQQRAETLAIQMQAAANSAVDIKLALFQRLAERFQLVDGLPSDRLWQQEVDSYFRDFPEIRLITMLDPKMRPVKTESRSLDDRFWIHDFLDLPQNQAWLRHVTETKVTHLSAPGKDSLDTSYAVIAAPSTMLQNRSWLVVATINLNDVFSELQQRKRGALELLVKYSGQTVFDSTGGARPEYMHSLSTQNLHTHHDSQWQIEVFTSDNTLQGDDFYLPPLILFTGLGLSFLMMLSHFFWRESVHHSWSLSTLNDTLNRHLEKLKEREALLRMTEQVAQIGGWIVDISSDKSIWSDAVCDIHEVPRGQAPDVDEAIRYYIPEHQQRIRDAVELCIETGLPFDEELQIRTAKGRLRWVRTIGHAVKDANGNIAKLHGAFQDITANRQATEQLRRYAERQATIFESITDAFFTLDKDWRFIYVNKRSEEILHRSRKELLGRTLWEWFPEAIGSEFDDQYRHAMETGESVSFEAYSSSLELWLEVSAYPSDEGLSVYYRSISERKEAQYQLEATLKELERSNKELQDFAFVASHDLQEPLRKIQAFSDRLISKSDRLTSQDQDYLKRMQSAAMRMQALILDLLSYSRVTTKAKPFVNIDTNQILQDVLQDMEATITRENAVLEISPLPTVHGDPTQIRQVFQNLLSNAVKFHPEDQPPRILVYPEDKAPDGWTLVVQDNGIGFDPKYADKLFHPFQRLHQKHEYAGTGIGMAIVKKILDRHNASIEVESAPNAGTTFRVRFVANKKEACPQDE